MYEKMINTLHVSKWNINSWFEAKWRPIFEKIFNYAWKQKVNNEYMFGNKRTKF